MFILNHIPGIIPVIAYLLNVLLEDAELEPLMQPDLPVLPEALQPPLVVQDLVHHVQDAVHRLGVIGSGRQRLSVPWTQRPLEDIQQGLAVLTDLETASEMGLG